MKESTSHNISIGILSIGMIIIIILVGIGQRSYESMFKPCQDFSIFLQQGERFKIYDTVQNKTVEHETKVAGIYSPDTDIYCVWNKTTMNKSEVEMHEMCHYLIDHGEREHFCR